MTPDTRRKDAPGCEHRARQRPRRGVPGLPTHPFWNVSTLNPTVGVVAIGAADCDRAIFNRLMIVVFPLLSRPTTRTETCGKARTGTAVVRRFTAAEEGSSVRVAPRCASWAGPLSFCPALGACGQGNPSCVNCWRRASGGCSQATQMLSENVAFRRVSAAVTHKVDREAKV